MAYGNFDFKGQGGSYWWLMIWTNFLTIITLGFYGPWAICARARWRVKNTFIDGKQLIFKGKGKDLFGIYFVTVLLGILTLGIYSFWGSVKIYKWIMLHTFFADEKEQQPVDLI